MDVRIDFLGDAHDAERAALSIDKALETLKEIADSVNRSLEGIRLDMRQVMGFQSGSAAMTASLRPLKAAAKDTAAAIQDVKYRPGQTAAFVAENAAKAASLRALGQSAIRANQDISGMQSLIGAAAREPNGAYAMPAAPGRVTDDYRGIRAIQLEAQRAANGALMMGGIPGDTYRGPIPLPRASGSVGDNRDFNFGNWAAHSGFPGGFPGGGYGGRRTVSFADSLGGDVLYGGALANRGMGNFGLSGGSTRRGGGGDSRLGSSLFGGGGDGRSGIGRGIFGGGGGGGGLLAGVLPGGRRATPAAIFTLAGAGIAAAPELLPAVLGPLAAIPAIAGTGAAALGTLMLALKGVGAAIGGDAKAYADLNAQQQQFVLTARGLNPFLEKLKGSASAGLMPGLTSGLNAAMSPNAQSTLMTGVNQMGAAMGGGANQMGQLFGSKFFTDLQGSLFKDGAQNIRVMGDAAVNLVAALTSLAHAGMPIFDWITQTIDAGARWVATWARMKDETGGFTSLLERTKTAWSDLVGIGGGLIHVVGDLAGILSGPGHMAIQGLIDLLHGLDRWLKGNHDNLKAFANTIVKDLLEAIRVVGPWIGNLVTLLGQLLGLLGQLPGPLKAIGDVAVVAGVISLAGGFSMMQKSIALLGKDIPLLKMSLLGLAANPVIAAMIAAFAVFNSTAGQGTGDNHISQHQYQGKTWSVPTGSDADRLLTKAEAGGKLTKAEQGQIARFGKQPGVISAGGGSPGGSASPYTGYQIPKSAGSGGAGGLTGKALTDYIVQRANALGLDPQAALAVAYAEGGFQGAIGDGGHAFGPYQANNAGGVATGMSAGRATSYFQSSQGIDYMLRYHASTAKGLSGTSAILRMIQNERPGDYLAGLKKGLTPDAAAMQTRDYRVASKFYDSGGTTGTNVPGGLPPMGTGKGALPAGLQIAMSQATMTSGLSDDLAANRAAQAYLQKVIPSLNGQDAVDAWAEFASLKRAEKTLVGQIGRANRRVQIPSQVSGTLSNLASVAGLVSGRTASDAVGENLSTAMTMEKSLGMPTGVLDKAKAQMAAINATLKQGFVSNDTLATIRANLGRIAGIVGDELAKAKQAAADRAAEFKQVFGNIAQQAVDAFQKVTNDVLAHPEKHADILPLTAQLLGLQDAHTQAALQDQLKQAQVDLAKALSGATSDSSGILAAARAKIGQDALAHALDVAQSAVLGGKPADMTAKIIKDMQEALMAGMPDPVAVAAARKAVTDAEYQITIDGLQKQSTAEISAYQDQRSELEKHLQESLKLWETYFSDLGHDAGQALADVNSVLAQLGLPLLPGSALQNSGTGPATSGPPGANGWQSGSGVVPGGGVGNYSPGVPAEMLASVLFGTPGGLNPATGKPYVGFADGGISFKPMIANVSEKGPEAHIPLNDPKAMAAMRQALGHDQHITLLVSAPDAQSWIEGKIEATVVGQSSAISRNIGVAANVRARSGAY